MRSEEWILAFISVGLLAVTILFIVDKSSLVGKCSEHVPPENCNKPAGDFAIEPDSTSSNIESGCGPNEDEPCVFTNINNPSEAIEKCNSLGNKCNRFVHNNKTMAVVSLSGKTSQSKGKHMYVRQNGVTYQGSGTPPDSRRTSNVSGSNTNVTTNSLSSQITSTPVISYNTGSTGSTGTTGSTQTSSTTPSSGGGGGYGGY